MVTLSSARSRVWGTVLLSADCRTILSSRVRVDELDDLLHGRAGKEDPANPHLLELGNVDVRNDPADDDQHITEPLGLEELHQPGGDMVVGAGQNRETDD